MKNWEQIEGFLKPADTNLLATFIKNVKESGWIIEVGCFKGRQSAFIASTKKESVLLSCIDPFPDKLVNFDDSRTYQNYKFTDWVENLRHYQNVEPVKGYSPFNISNFSLKKFPDLMIYDVDQIYDSLVFWHQHSVSKPAVLVHTYINEHQRIVSQVEKFVIEYNYNFEMTGQLAILKYKNEN